MKAKLLYLLILSFIVFQARSYAIEGNWKITEIQGRRLPQKHTLKAEIRDFIFRNKTIRWTITFSGCQSLKVMLDIQGKDLFIDFKTLFINNTNLLNCSQQLLSYQKRITSPLNRAFIFQIMNTFMIFTDPRGEVLFKFERISNNQLDRNLTGAWMVNEVKGKPFSESLDIEDEQFIFCQRSAKSKYRILGGNKIQFRNQQNGTCQDKNLLTSFKSPLFLVRRKNKLELYDQNDEICVSLFYMMNLESAKKFRENQQKAKQEKQNAERKVIEERKKKDQQRRLQIQKQERQQKQRDKARLETKTPNGGAQTVTTQPRPFQILDFFGKWKLVKVLGALPVLTAVNLIIAKDQMILTGECKTFTMTYSMVSQAPIKVKRESLKQTQSKCISEDQQLYKNALMKISIFQIRLQKDKTILKLYDEKMKQVFEIERNGQIKIETIKVVSAPKVVRPPPPPPKDLADGRYTILLLSKIDAGKKILNVKNNQFTINACNSLIVNFQISKDKKIAFKVKVEGDKKNCDALDKLYIGQLQKGRSIIKDEEDFMIRDEKGKEIITFNPL